MKAIFFTASSDTDILKCVSEWPARGMLNSSGHVTVSSETENSKFVLHVDCEGVSELICVGESKLRDQDLRTCASRCIARVLLNFRMQVKASSKNKIVNSKFAKQMEKWKTKRSELEVCYMLLYDEWYIACVGSSSPCVSELKACYMCYMLLYY